MSVPSTPPRRSRRPGLLFWLAGLCMLLAVGVLVFGILTWETASPPNVRVERLLARASAGGVAAKPPQEGGELCRYFLVIQNPNNVPVSIRSLQVYFPTAGWGESFSMRATSVDIECPAQRQVRLITDGLLPAKEGHDVELAYTYASRTRAQVVGALHACLPEALWPRVPQLHFATQRMLVRPELLEMKGPLPAEYQIPVPIPPTYSTPSTELRLLQLESPGGD